MLQMKKQLGYSYRERFSFNKTSFLFLLKQHFKLDVVQADFCCICNSDSLGLFLLCFGFQTPALNLLWEKCCSDNVVVRTTCCEALVTLVAQDHAEFTYVLNGALNLIPSAR